MRKAYQLGFGTTGTELNLEKLTIRGKLPEWLSGDLIRNGPGTFRVGNDQYRHWFDGLAMLHRFSFDSGELAYRNRFLDCKAYREAMDTKQIRYSEFATDPRFSFADRLKMLFQSPMTDSAKVNVARIGEKVLALSETSKQIQFDPETLKSIAEFSYDSQINRHVTTVHPQYDRLKNCDYNMTTRFNRISRYRILQVGETRKPKLEASIPVSEISYMHSFGMSPNYFIVTEFPFQVNPLQILFSKKPFIENFKWKPERGTRMHIINRESGSLEKTLLSDPFFSFHHVNAFEEDGQLLMDMVCYPDAEVIQAFYLERIFKEDQALQVGEFRRYRINLKEESISYEVLCKEGLELPRYDEGALSMSGAYRYVYGVGVHKDHPQSFYNQLVKLDIQAQTSLTWYQEGCYPGEAVFIGKPGRASEDDGVVVSVILDEASGNSFLLVLDASDLKELARAEVPHPILFGYHGSYLGKAE
jgi:carotenoid cleavage dioxygenase-like enzyme